MRVLLLAQFYPPDIGGEERHVQALANELVHRGHEVDVLTSALPTARAGESLEEGVRVTRVQTTAQRLPLLYGDAARPHAAPVADPAMRKAIAEAIERRNYDVIHAHNWIVNSALGPARATTTPLLLTLHDYSHVCATKRYMRNGELCSGPAVGRCVVCSAHHYGLIGPLVAAANALNRYRRNGALDRLIPVSSSVAARNHLNVDNERVQIVPNFIPDSLLVEEPSPLGGPIVFVGDLIEDKGAQVLLEAYKMLPQPPKLLLAGRVPPGVAITPPSGAQILGPRPHTEVLELMRSAGVVVVPSIVPDSCPTVVLEAMACGRPVVASRAGGIVDMIIDGESGLLVPPGDAASLAKALQRLLEDSDLATSLARSGREAVEAFTASSVVSRLEQLYRSCDEDAPISSMK